MNDYQLVVVLAGNAPEADDWRRKEGLKRREFIYAGSPRSLDGACPTRVVQLPGFALRHDYAAPRLRLMVQYVLRKSKTPIGIELL